MCWTRQPYNVLYRAYRCMMSVLAMSHDYLQQCVPASATFQQSSGYGAQVLEARLERGDSEWVAKHTAELLGSSRQSTGSQQLRCNRTRLMMLAFRSRLDSGNSQSLTSVEQKHVFCAWPHSVQVWNLFSRYAAFA